MKTDTPALSAQEQIAAAELISEMIAQGCSASEAIKIVAEKIRREHQGDYIHVIFDHDEDNLDKNEDLDIDSEDGDGYDDESDDDYDEDDYDDDEDPFRLL